MAKPPYTVENIARARQIVADSTSGYEAEMAVADAMRDHADDHERQARAHQDYAEPYKKWLAEAPEGPAPGSAGPCLCPKDENGPGDPDWDGETASNPACPYHGATSWWR